MVVHEVTKTLLGYLTPEQWSDAIRLYHENKDGKSLAVVWYHITEQDKRHFGGEGRFHEQILELLPTMVKEWMSRYVEIWA